MKYASQPWLALAAFVALCSMSSCGGGGGEVAVVHEVAPAVAGSADLSALHEINVWARDAGKLSTEVDGGMIDPVDFELRRPPPRVQLHRAEPYGWSIGFDAYLSNLDIQAFSDLRNTDEANFTCYVFDFYLQHPGGISPGEFENYMFENLVHYYLPPSPREQLAGKISRIREAIIQAENAPEAVANAALATFCSLPGGG